MKILFDLNVLLDVIQNRKPHYAASARACALASRCEIEAFIPSHAVTTLAYITRKYADKKKERTVLEWIMRTFTVLPAGHQEIMRAMVLPMQDFEDAVVAAVAESARCTYILSRNVGDFTSSPVPAVTPEEFLQSILSKQ